MKNFTSLILLLFFCFASAYAVTTDKAPPGKQYAYCIVVDLNLDHSGNDLTALHFDVILPDNGYTLYNGNYPFVESIGKPTGQLHESLLASNPVTINRSGLHRMRNTK